MASALCTVSDPQKNKLYAGRHLTKVTWAWTSATGGTVTSTVSKTTFTITGFVAQVSIKPGAATPTSYNMTLKDSWGRTIALKAAASTTAVEDLDADYYIWNDTLEVAIDSAGDEKTGHVIAYIVTQ